MNKDTLTLIVTFILTTGIARGIYYLFRKNEDLSANKNISATEQVVSEEQQEEQVNLAQQEAAQQEAQQLQQKLQQQADERQRQQEEIQQQQIALQQKLLQQQAELEEKQRQLEAQLAQAETVSSFNVNVSTSESDAPRPNRGMWVVKVNPGEEADLAGLRVGQILISLNGRYIEDVSDANLVVGQNVNREIQATVWDRGKYKQLKVVPFDRYMGITLCKFSNCPNGRLP